MVVNENFYFFKNIKNNNNAFHIYMILCISCYFYLSNKFVEFEIIFLDLKIIFVFSNQQQQKSGSFDV